MPFEFEPCEIPEVVLIKPKIFSDERGYFLETYKKSDWESAGLPTDFSQDNESFSHAGVLRGMHYQVDPYAQGKLVRVVHGSIFDVAVDIRKHSQTYGHWVGRILSAENKHMLWIPKGFAHGLLVLEDNTSLLYKCVGEYHKNAEKTFLWSDPAIGVRWPLEKLNGRPILLKDQDKNAPMLARVSA